MLPLAPSPESEGVSSARLAEFVDRFFSLRWTHGLVVLRHGRVVAECYRELCSPADRHQLFSLSKSFTSSAVGIALGEGLIPSLDAPLVSFFPEYDSPRVTERMRRVTLRHLLCMGMGRASCGLWGDRYGRLHQAFAAAHGDDARAVAARFASGEEFFDDDLPVVQHLLEDELRDEPGSRFEYNTGATFLLSTVLQKVTGQRLPDYLRSRLFDPLGIARDVVWDDLPGTGITLGGAGLNLTVREIAAAGQLWLRGGVLPDGRRLIPASYMAEATAKQIENDGPGRAPEWSQGYGYQFWRCRHGAFRGDGASGQLAVMLPEQDAVVAATAGVCGMQEELDAIWETLLPAFADAPLPPDPSGLARLREAEASQRFDLGPAGAPRLAAFPFGEPRRFACAPNPFGLSALTLAQDERGATLEFAFGDGLVDLLRAGWDAPCASQLRRLASGHSFGAFARAAWITPARLQIKAAVPCSTSFFTLEFDLAASCFRSRTPIWFAHPWLQEATVTLEPVPDGAGESL